MLILEENFRRHFELFKYHIANNFFFLTYVFVLFSMKHLKNLKIKTMYTLTFQMFGVGIILSI